MTTSSPRQPEQGAGPPVALLVGCSGGIGEAVAQVLAEAGLRVYGTSRSGRSTGGTDLTPLALDVTDAASVAGAVDHVVAEAGRLDVLVHNAGVTLVGALEETSTEEALGLLDTNLLGAHRVVRAALPHLRAARGRVVLTGSLAGVLTKPYEGWYCVSKHGLEAYAEALRAEVRPLGVRVTLLEPGYIRTDLAQHAALVAEPMGLYDRARRSTVAILRRDVAKGVPPTRVAQALQRVLGQDDPPRVLVGPDAQVLGVVKRLLPDRLFERGLGVKYRVRDEP